MSLVLPSLRGRWSVHPLALGALVIVVLATLTTTLSSPGRIIADARYEHLGAPLQFLLRHGSLWDDGRGPGQPAIYFSPTVSSFQALLDVVGVPAWLIGRLTLAALLSIAGIGVMWLAYQLGLTRVAVATSAGLLYAFSPFTSQFLLPSGLFLPTALLPWLVLFVLAGLREPRPERWAALIALSIFAVGLLNGAALVYVLVPVVMLVAMMVWVEHTVPLRQAVALAWRTALLTTGVSAAMLVVNWFSLPVIGRNLTTTELPTTVARTTSSFESWRGLGLWVNHVRQDGALLHPAVEPFYTSAVAVMATYVALALALLGLSTTKLRHRVGLGALLAISALLMIGGHRPEASPLAWLNDQLMERSVTARGFRSSYKAGAGLQLAVALLGASGASWLVDRGVERWSTSRSSLRLAVSGLLASLLALGPAVAASPFLTGALLNERQSFEQLPDHWSEVFDWFDENTAVDDEVFVLPGVSRARYTWGYVNDNLFDAHLLPRALMAQTLTAATPELARSIEQLDRRFSSDSVEPEAVAPMLRWLGVGWVLLQNLDPSTRDAPSPEEYDDLRSAPGLSVAATFGRISGGRPAIEVLRVDASPRGALFSRDAPVIVSGAADAAAALARNGWLNGTTTLLSQLDDEALDDMIARGATVVVTDGARRRAVRATSSRLVVSHTLAEQFEPGRPIDTPSSDPSTQTVAGFGDAASVRASRAGLGGEIWEYDARAANAVDGDPTTAWRLRGQGTSLVGEWLRIDLVTPTLVDHLVLEAYAVADRAPTAFHVRTTDARGATNVSITSVDVSGPVQVNIGREVSVIELTIAEVIGQIGQVGLRNVEVVTPDGPLDFREWLRVPTEITRLENRGEPPSIVYVFGRSVFANEERVLRRQFSAIAERDLVLSARLRDAPVALLDGGCTPAFDLDGEAIEIEVVAVVGGAVDVRSCDPVVVSVGKHRIEERSDFAGTVVDLQLAEQSTGRSSDLRVLEHERKASDRHRIVLGEGRGFLLSSVPAHPGWVASGSDRLAAPLVLNGRQAWAVTDGPVEPVELHFWPQSLYQLALALSAAMVMLCLYLALRRRAR